MYPVVQINMVDVGGRQSNVVYPWMAVGVCVSAKRLFCIVCRYGYPNETGEDVREPRFDPALGDDDRDIRGLVIFGGDRAPSTGDEMDCGGGGLNGPEELMTLLSALALSSGTITCLLG